MLNKLNPDFVVAVIMRLANTIQVGISGYVLAE